MPGARSVARTEARARFREAKSILPEKNEATPMAARIQTPGVGPYRGPKRGQDRGAAAPINMLPSSREISSKQGAAVTIAASAPSHPYMCPLLTRPLYAAFSPEQKKLYRKASFAASGPTPQPNKRVRHASG